MSTVKPRRSPDEVARIGMEIYDRQIRSQLKPEDTDKFIAIDIESGEYELDGNDRMAVKRLRGRLANADVYVARVGHPAAHRIRATR